MVGCLGLPGGDRNITMCIGGRFELQTESGDVPENTPCDGDDIIIIAGQPVSGWRRDGLVAKKLCELPGREHPDKSPLFFFPRACQKHGRRGAGASAPACDRRLP